MTASGFMEVPFPAWLRQEGPDMDVVVSTRCRIARNLEGHQFPHRAKDAELRQVDVLCGRAVMAVEPRCRSFDRMDLQVETLEQLTVGRFVSQAWATFAGPGRVHVASDGLWSVMVNEEDHLRIQCVAAGLAPDSAAHPARALADRLAQRLPLAGRPAVGFLTASLANAGTGLRLGFLLHVPALALEKGFLDALAAAEHLGCSVRGVFGEGTRGTGAFVQVSNRCTFGPSAEYALERVIAACRYLVEREREARGALIARRDGLQDLTEAGEGARLTLLTEDVDTPDLLRCISAFRLAVAVGVTDGDLIRTGEWVSLASMVMWYERHGERGTQRYARERALARIRRGLREPASPWSACA